IITGGGDCGGLACFELLHACCRHGQHGHRDTGLVHDSQPLVLDVDQTPADTCMLARNVSGSYSRLFFSSSRKASSCSGVANASSVAMRRKSFCGMTVPRSPSWTGTSWTLSEIARCVERLDPAGPRRGYCRKNQFAATFSFAAS